MEKHHAGDYGKFGLMMLVSFVIMFFIMFVNVDRIDHVIISTSRIYVTIIMICAMAIVMLLFMWKMYTNRVLNYAILGSSLVVGFVTVWALREQVPVGDVQWMKAMIPHHSVAIMVSQEADLENPEVRELAKEIIEAQEREIAQMQKLIYKIENQQ